MISSISVPHYFYQNILSFKITTWYPQFYFWDGIYNSKKGFYYPLNLIFLSKSNYYCLGDIYIRLKKGQSYGNRHDIAITEP